jgi:serine/threonine protein kinase
MAYFHVIDRRSYCLSADIYSFGITVVEVAVGHAPYTDQSFEQLAINKVSNPIMPLLAVDSYGKRLSTVLIRTHHYVNSPERTLCVSHVAAVFAYEDKAPELCLQELGELVAACLQLKPEDRPTASQLLKHKFFKKAAKDPRQLVQHLWNAIPEAQPSASFDDNAGDPYFIMSRVFVGLCGNNDIKLWRMHGTALISKRNA